MKTIDIHAAGHENVAQTAGMPAKRLGTVVPDKRTVILLACPRNPKTNPAISRIGEPGVESGGSVPVAGNIAHHFDIQPRAAEVGQIGRRSQLTETRQEIRRLEHTRRGDFRAFRPLLVAAERRLRRYAKLPG